MTVGFLLVNMKFDIFKIYLRFSDFTLAFYYLLVTFELNWNIWYSNFIQIPIQFYYYWLLLYIYTSSK